MEVRVTTWARLHASSYKRRSSDCGHYNSHVQLRAESVHPRSDIGSISHKVEPSPLSLCIISAHRMRRHTAILRVQTMQLVIVVVALVQGKPNCWDTAIPDVVLHYQVLAYVTERRIPKALWRVSSLTLTRPRLHPRRNPRHMLHSAIQLLTLIRPMHWR